MQINRLEQIIHDRGSCYSVSGASVSNIDEVKAALRLLKSKKKYAKATHNTWAVVFADGGRHKDDDGESGAGRMILDRLQQDGVTNHVIIVTRWYGGVHLGADRFRHVRACVSRYIAEYL